MGNSAGCLVPAGKGNGKSGVDLQFLEPLEEGLGHSFCYVRPVIESPASTPSISERFTIDSSIIDSEAHSGSFRHEAVDESGFQKPTKGIAETTFKTISGASVSANAPSSRTVTVYDHCTLFAGEPQERAASFEGTASFAALPLQPVPRGSGPLNGFMSGPLERGFTSGPLERGSGFMSGPIERGFLSGPLDNSGNVNFSAPLAFGQRKAGLGRFMRSMSKPLRNALSRTFSRTSRSGWVQRLLLQPASRLVWSSKEAKFHADVPRNDYDASLASATRTSEGDHSSVRNLQWAHGKAGEDRVHVVVSEEHGWLFVGIYDGFNGPDAPDFLMSNLYRAVDKELKGLLWEYDDHGEPNPHECSSRLELYEGLTDKSDHRHEDDLPSQPCKIISNDRSESSEAESAASISSIAASSAGINQLGKASDDSSSTKTCSAGISVTPPTHNSENVQHVDEKVCSGGTGTDLEKSSLLDAKIDLQACESACDKMQDKSGTSWSKLAGQGRRSKRLFELFKMEDADFVSLSARNDVGMQGFDSLDEHPKAGPGDIESRELVPIAQSRLSSESGKVDNFTRHRGDGNSTEDAEPDSNESNDNVKVPSFDSGAKPVAKGSMIGSQLRKMYRKQKYLHKKLFRWSFHWGREHTDLPKRVIDSVVLPRRCKTGPIDHEAVLAALSRALEITEDAYMDMVDRVLQKNPELALMGSCVLVMLMKDQDVYVVNLGDSRVILAQDRLHDHHNPILGKDDARHRMRSRDPSVRVELDRISEESPMHGQNTDCSKNNKLREISLCRLKMRAFQLSTDHSTSVEEDELQPADCKAHRKLSTDKTKSDHSESWSMTRQDCLIFKEVLRIKREHPDDDQAILNDRVKGQLKVSRAFGAGFLKKAKWNDALLEMFRIDYIGNSPYLSCIPSVAHHRLCSSDRFLILSSDGLYQYFSNEEVVSHVEWFMENVPEGDPAQYLITELLFRAAKKNGMDFHELLDIPHGDRRKYHDDVSVMVVSLEGRIWRSSG